MKKVTFGSLKIGDVFSLSQFHTLEHFNIKVQPSVVEGSTDFGAFNVIAFDGRPRTFQDDEKVYLRILAEFLHETHC